MCSGKRDPGRGLPPIPENSLALPQSLPAKESHTAACPRAVNHSFAALGLLLVSTGLWGSLQERLGMWLAMGAAQLPFLGDTSQSLHRAPNTRAQEGRPWPIQGSPCGPGLPRLIKNPITGGTLEIIQSDP